MLNSGAQAIYSSRLDNTTFGRVYTAINWRSYQSSLARLYAALIANTVLWHGMASIRGLSRPEGKLI